MFSRYKYLIVYLVFSPLGFRGGNLFLIAPLSDRCLLVPFLKNNVIIFLVSGLKDEPGFLYTSLFSICAVVLVSQVLECTKSCSNDMLCSG